MSSDLDTKFPEIFYDKEKKEKYEYLVKDVDSPFRDKTYASIFIFAMALAKKKKLLPVDLKQQTKMPQSAFDSRMRSLMRSIMMDEMNDVYCIGDNLKLRKMCEGYANAGIDVLYLRIKERRMGENAEDILADLIESKA